MEFAVHIFYSKTVPDKKMFALDKMIGIDLDRWNTDIWVIFVKSN